MLIYNDFFFNGKEWTTVQSDEGRAVLCDGVEYAVVSMPNDDLKPCEEGEFLPTTDDIDDAEAYNIIFGGGAE